MEAVGLKIAQLPKQLMRSRAISSALGKGIKPTINGITQCQVVAGNMGSQISPCPTVKASCFSNLYLVVVVFSYS